MRFFIILFITHLFTSTSWAQLAFPKKKSHRIAVLGCLRQLEPAPALYQYTQLDADLALWIGDNIYSDTKDDPTLIQQNYEVLGSLPAFKAFRAQVPFLATWDDHDYGYNNYGKEYPFKEQSKQYFRSFWQLEHKIPEQQNGIYYSEFKQVDHLKIQFIFLDPRYNRDEVRLDGKGDTLGEEQWAWLEKELLKKADLRFIVSGYQVLLTEASSSETWQRFPSAAERLFDTIKHAHAEGVIFLTGDQHYGEVLRAPKRLGYDAIELQFAGINQIEGAEYNPLRVAPVITSKHSVAFIDIQSQNDEKNVPHLDFMIYDAISGQNEINYRVRLDELKYQFEIEGATAFVDETHLFIKHQYAGLHLRYTSSDSVVRATDPVMDKAAQFNTSTQLTYALFDSEGIQRSETRSLELEKLPLLEGVSKNQIDTHKAGLHVKYAEGEWKNVPSFDTLTIVNEFIVPTPSLNGISVRDDHFALEFEGIVWVDQDGFYEWMTVSDDGSVLYLHDQKVVDNDGSHSKRQRSGRIALKKGWHPMTLRYFEDYAGQSLELGYRLVGESEWRKPSPQEFKH